MEIDYHHLRGVTIHCCEVTQTNMVTLTKISSFERIDVVPKTYMQRTSFDFVFTNPSDVCLGMRVLNVKVSRTIGKPETEVVPG